MFKTKVSIAIMTAKILSLRGSRGAADEIIDATQRHNPRCSATYQPVLSQGALLPLNQEIASPASRDRRVSSVHAIRLIAIQIVCSLSSMIDMTS